MSGLYRENGNSHVFIGARTGAGLGNMAMPEVLQQMEQSDVTVHGFRSTFRDWAAEATASLALAPHWRRFLRAQRLLQSGMVDRNKALRSFTSSPSCRSSNATSVGHSPVKGELYGLYECTNYAKIYVWPL